MHRFCNIILNILAPLSNYRNAWLSTTKARRERQEEQLHMDDMNRSSQPSRTHLPRGLFEAAPDHSAVTRLGCGFRSNGTSEPIPVRWLTVDQSRLRMLCVHVCVSQTHYCMLCEVIHSMYTQTPQPFAPGVYVFHMLHTFRSFIML